MLAISISATAWLKADLKAEHIIDGFGLILSHVGALPTAFIFQGSEDGVIWTDLGNSAVASIGAYGYDVPESSDGVYIFQLLIAEELLHLRVVKN